MIDYVVTHESHRGRAESYLHVLGPTVRTVGEKRLSRRFDPGRDQFFDRLFLVTVRIKCPTSL